MENIKEAIPGDYKPIRKEYIEVEPNVKLHVSDGGEGRPIVLVHGWPLSDEMYEYQYSDLLKNKFRVIGITLRGFGKSDKPFGNYNYDVFAKDIQYILHKLDLKDVVLGGFSMGGAIAIRYVSSFDDGRIAKLALFGAAAPSWVQRRDFPFNLTVKEVDELITLCYRDRPELLTKVGSLFASSETALSAGISNWLYEMGLSSSFYAMVKCLMALRDADLRGDLLKITIPTLILHGKLDKICTFEMANKTHEGIPGSKLIPFEKSGHALFLEETEKFNAELIRFATA